MTRIPTNVSSNAGSRESVSLQIIRWPIIAYPQQLSLRIHGRWRWAPEGCDVPSHWPRQNRRTEGWLIEAHRKVHSFVRRNSLQHCIPSPQLLLQQRVWRLMIYQPTTEAKSIKSSWSLRISLSFLYRSSWVYREQRKLMFAGIITRHFHCQTGDHIRVKGNVVNSSVYFSFSGKQFNRKWNSSLLSWLWPFVVL